MSVKVIGGSEMSADSELEKERERFYLWLGELCEKDKEREVVLH